MKMRLALALLALSSCSAALASEQATASGAKQPRGRKHIRLVTVESPPFMMRRRAKLEDGAAGRQPQAGSPAARERPNGGAEWFGYCMDFFLELIKHLPYEVTYEIREVADGKFGAKTRDVVSERRNVSGRLETHFRRSESWNGLVGELARQQAELALAPMAVMAERELAVDFTVPFYDLVGIQILLKRPEVPQNWFKFLTVLDNDVWLSIALAYLLTSLVIFLFDRLSPYSHKNQARIQRLRARRAQRAHEPATAAAAAAAARLPAEGHKFYLSRALAAVGPASELGGGLGGVPSAEQARRQQAALMGRLHFKLLGGSLSGSPGGATGPPGLLAVGGGDVGSPRRRLSQDYLLSLRARLGGARRKRPAGAGEDEAMEDVDMEEDAEAEEEDAEESEDEDEEDCAGAGKPDFNFRDSLWFCITSLTPQGGGEAPQNLSGRVVAGAWWLFCFIVIASYTANLAAFLTVSRLDIPIESLDDLAKQYRIKYAPIDGTAEQTYFERMAYIEEIFYNIWKEMSLNESLGELERSKFSVWDYPISDKYTKIWAQIQEASMPTSIESALERVKSSTLDDGFALLADANLIKYAVMTDCSLKAVGEEFSRKPIALALAKGHEQLRDDISYAILQLINQRFMEVLREKWWTNNAARVACANSNDESEGISIENIGGVFIIILAGVLLSFLAWALERLAYAAKLDMSRHLLEQQLTSGGGGGGRASETGDILAAAPAEKLPTEQKMANSKRLR